MKTAILLLPFFIILSSCEKPDVKLEDAKPLPLKAGMEKRVQQDNLFAFDLMKNVIENNADADNIFLSPLSVSIALGMVWNGADGETKSEIATALKMSEMTPDQINEYYHILLTSLPKVDPTTKLNIANSIWYKLGFPVYPAFLKTNSDYFNAEVREIDFTDPKSVDLINGWCANKTNNLIKKPLDRISADAVMYLVNAIYFKGIWANKFDKKDTQTQDFYPEDGKAVSVKMMKQLDKFRYTEDDMAQYLDMPYGNKAFSMTVILPKEKQTTATVLNKLNLDRWNDILATMSSQEIDVSIPKFKVEAKYELKEPLIAMGMVNAFSYIADFSKISDFDLIISRILHSTYCDVNEEGTEAAVVTIVEVEMTSMPMNKVFNANKPFIFVIREKSTGVILFIGKMGKVEMYQ